MLHEKSSRRSQLVINFVLEILVLAVAEPPEAGRKRPEEIHNRSESMPTAKIGSAETLLEEN